MAEKELPEFKRERERQWENAPKEILEEIKRFECPKTAQEIEGIGFADKITNQLLVECGVLDYEFPEEGVRLFPAGFYKKTTGSGGGGRADHIMQAVILNADKVRGKGNLRFANIAFHEMLHIKSFADFKDGILLQRGLEIELKKKSEDKNEIFYRTSGLFGGLNEAITSHYERYFIKEALKSDLFKEEKEWLESEEAKTIKQKISQESGYSEEDIYTVTKDGLFDTHGYPVHEKVLKEIADKIYQDNPDKFESQREVIKEFLKAMLSGNSLQIKELVEKSFGPDRWRVLGMIKEDKQSAIEALGYFK